MSNFITKIKNILNIIKTDLADTWNRSKVFILAILGIIAAIEFQKIKQFLLVYMGQKEIKKDDVQDQKLANEENSDNNQANALEQQAASLSSEEKSVESDWYKKKN
jgi:hypothetical protein